MAKSSVNVSQTQNKEGSLDSCQADAGTKPDKLDDWTKEHVCQWLIDVVKVPQQYAEILYKEDVYGAALILFEKQDFLDAGLKHGPAVQILKSVSQFKTSSDVLKNIVIRTDTAAFLGTSTPQGPTSGSDDPEITPKISIQEKENRISGVQSWSEEASEFTHNKGKTLHEASGFQVAQDDLKCQKRGGASSAFRLCKPRPFDESCPLFEYTQNEILPPESGPSNLIDPLHEYKLMANTENVPEKDVLKKFTNEVFWFAAACMNSRTNGTIHFGVGDEEGDKPVYKHGQIIGIEVTSPKKYIDAFDKGLKEHFTNHISIVTRCIRPPKFFKVKCPDNINANKWIIEVDVVPMYNLTVEKRFHTALDKKRRKSKSLFIRDGANTTDHLPEYNPKKKRQNEKNLNNEVKIWASSRSSAEEWHRQKRGITIYIRSEEYLTCDQVKKTQQ